MTTTDALVEALEFLVERFGPNRSNYMFSQRLALDKACAALALARAEQAEPWQIISFSDKWPEIAVDFKCQNGRILENRYFYTENPDRITYPDGSELVWWRPRANPPATASEQAKQAKLEPLTKDEVCQVAARTLGEMHVEYCGLGDLIEFAEELTAAHNARLATPPAPVPQPVQVEPGGWRLVPVEPTPEMLHQADKDCAGIGADSCGEHVGLDYDDYRSVFESMLAAAPPPPKREPLWQPQFDGISHKQETLVKQFCAEIAGPFGIRVGPPDPVRLLEMAEALYRAEAEDAAHGITPKEGG